MLLMNSIWFWKITKIEILQFGKQNEWKSAWHSSHEAVTKAQVFSVTYPTEYFRILELHNPWFDAFYWAQKRQSTDFWDFW